MRAGSGRESPASASQVGKALPGQPAPGHRALSLPPCTETAHLNQFADIQNLELLHSHKSETHGNTRAVWWALLPSPSTESRAMYTVGAQLLCPLSTELPMPLSGSFQKQSHGLESSLLVWWRQISDSVPQGATSKRLPHFLPDVLGQKGRSLRMSGTLRTVLANLTGRPLRLQLPSWQDPETEG